MLSAAQRALGQAFSVRRAELRRVLPLTLAYGLVLASLYVLKPARNALFLAQLGVEQLPYVLLLVAAVGGVFALLYGRLTRSLAIETLVQRTFLILMVMLAGFRLLFASSVSGAWVFYTFYVWVALYGLVTTSLVWLLANSAFTSREARRVFGLIGTGGIGGAIVGGLSTGELAELLGTENLLLVCMGLLGGCLVLFRLLPSSSRTEAPRRGDAGSAFGLSPIFSSPLLRNLALATGLIAAVAVIVDVQFNHLVDAAFVEQDEKTAFFGRFFAALSAFSFIFQLLLTPFILRVLGVGPALTILPAALGLGSLALFLVPGLLSGLIAKSADGGFRHSVHKAASEVLFLPVPAEMKKHSKLFLDTTVDTTATGLGALAVLVLIENMGLRYETLSVLSAGLMAGTLVVIRRLRHAYVDAFRQALERRRIDLAQLRTSLAEAGALELLRPALHSENPRQVVYVLDLLGGLRHRSLIGELDELLHHPSLEVRRRALELRVEQEEPLTETLLLRLLDDEDVDIRASALARLASADSDGGTQRLDAALQSKSPKLRAAALGALAEVGPSQVVSRLDPTRVEVWLNDSSFQPLLADLARALGRLGDPALDEALMRMLRTAEPPVVRAAIEGMGRGRNRAWLPWLIERLDDVEQRSATRAALVAFGSDGVSAIAALLDETNLSPSLHRALPRILGRIPTQSSVEVLMAHLDAPDPLVAQAVRRALAKLRAGFQELRFERRRVREALWLTARRHHEARRAFFDLDTRLSDEPVSRLLLRSLEEVQALEVEAVLDLLSLRHDPTDIGSARQGFRSGAAAAVRASALELLDNVVEKASREPALAVLDDAAADRPTSLFGRAHRDVETTLLDLLEGENAWIRACAAHVAAHRGTARLLAQVRQLESDKNPFVRGAALRALEPTMVAS